MTNLPIPITEEEKIELEELLNELESGVNANGRKTKWTDTKASRVKTLQRKQKGEDELSAGIMNHLDDVFRSQFWKRRRHLTNKYLEKGLLCEQDILDLLSKADNDFYTKNDEHFSNEYIQGSWDNYLVKVRDTKANYDLKTFDESELTSLYKWQLHGYSFLAKEEYNLPSYPDSELVFGFIKLQAKRRANFTQTAVRITTTKIGWKSNVKSSVITFSTKRFSFEITHNINLKILFGSTIFRQFSD